MKILTIIGNGFDLGHELPTKFENFIETDGDVLGKKYEIFRKGDNNWNEIESKYENLLRDVIENRGWIDVTEEVDNIIQDYGLNEYGEVNYYNYVSEVLKEEKGKIAFYVDLLKEFEDEFLQYLKIRCSDKLLEKVPIRSKIAQILLCSDKIINFNYTNTIEIVYGISNVIHIHGNIHEDIEIGCANIEELKKSQVDYDYPTIEKFGKDKHGFMEMLAYYEYDMEGNLVENHFKKRFFDEVSSEIEDDEEELFELLDKKNKDTLKLRDRIIKKLQKERFDEVYIIGHSLGRADYAVLDAIHRNTKMYCYYHTPQDYERMKKILGTMGFNFELLSDEELYK